MMKRLLDSCAQFLATAFASIAFAGVKHNSSVWLYEPEIPEELMK
jgi:cyclic lactone autoinducer peptide